MPKITLVFEDVPPNGVNLSVIHNVPDGQPGFSQAMLIGAAVMRMWKNGELAAAPDRLCQDILERLNTDNGAAS
jgi:hypothetical protein